MRCSHSLQLCLPSGSLWYNANYALLYTETPQCPQYLELCHTNLNIFCPCLHRSVLKQRRQQRTNAQFILRESLPVCFKGLCGERQRCDEWRLCARSWRRERRGSRRAYLTDECPACAARVRDSPCSVSLKAGGDRGWTQ